LWSGTAQGSEDAEDAWPRAFQQNSQWKGLYDYDGHSVQFTLVIHSASEQVVKATLHDRFNQLKLIGTPPTDNKTP